MLQNDINNIRFPLINIRRTSNLAVAPINTFALAIGLFMISTPLMKWCEFTSPTLGVALACGGVCLYVMGIYNWYQNKTVLCFIDFSFSFLFFLICYFFHFTLKDKFEQIPITTVTPPTMVQSSTTPIKIDNTIFENYMIGTFFVLYLIALVALALACKNKGLIHLAYLGLLILADIMIIIWEYRYRKTKNDKIKERLRKSAGYFLFFASLVLWYSGVARFINEIFQKELIPLISPHL